MSSTVDETTKRFRLHVLKEIYQTEKDYTESLEFTVYHILAKMKQSKRALKMLDDSSLTEDDISKIFCNIEELLEIHRLLLADLTRDVTPTPSFDATLSKCYLQHCKAMMAYKEYVENNELSQKVIYKLEDQPAFKAFIIGVMLIGGANETSINSYLFKPIQRICKYPLLFKELLKYTPEGHKDYDNTVEALAEMRKLCSLTNEAKRRVEKLEAIADFQATVEGWEGSSLVDTCSELIKEGPLVKISAGNMQERMFFLYDNLLVYCKRSGFPLRAKTVPFIYGLSRYHISSDKNLIFKGRIPVANIEIENIEDGKADYHTSGYTVTNGWRMRNLAKNKWFVLIAKTPQDKQQWLEAVRSQKDKIKRVAAGVARDTRTVMLDKGRKLHERIHKESKILHDHRYWLKTHSKSFTGIDFIKWLIEIGEASNGDEGVRLGQALLESGVIHHVGDKHQFKNSQLAYVFRYDDGTFQTSVDAKSELAKGLRVYSCLNSLYKSPLHDHKSGLRSIRLSISGTRLVDWLLKERLVETRKEGVAFGVHLMATGLLKHSTDNQKFNDTGAYYQFVPDAVFNQPLQQMDFVPISTFLCQTIMVPYSSAFRDYGIKLTETAPVKIMGVTSGGPGELTALRSGLEVVNIGGQWLNGDISDLTQCAAIMDSQWQKECPLELVVYRDKAYEEVKLRSNGQKLGMQLKGTKPVIISSVEGGTEASRCGITPGRCIISINDEHILEKSHDQVIGLIRESKTTPNELMKLSLSISAINHMTRYQYESTEDAMYEVVRRVMESPYVYQLPAQLFKLYEEEAVARAKLLRAQKLSNTQLQDYITELEVQADVYHKTSTALNGPRYPSFRPYGIQSTPILEACPINFHTLLIEVGPSSKTLPHSPTSTEAAQPIPESNGVEQSPHFVVDHYLHTMSYPYLMNRTRRVDEVQVMNKCHRIRQLLAFLSVVYMDIVRDCESLKKLTDQNCCPVDSPHLSVPKRLLNEEISSENRPSSPSLSARRPYTRERNFSVANPSQVINLVLNGVLAKIQSFIEYLNDEDFLIVLEDVTQINTTTTKEELLKKWKEKLGKYKSHLSTLEATPEAANKFAVLIQGEVRMIKKEIQAYLEIALAFIDNVEITYTWDRLFSQCLVAAVTSFANHLVSAANERLNHSPEYYKDPTQGSQEWLDMIVARGDVLICFEGLLSMLQPTEMSSLKDLKPIIEQLKRVKFHVKEQNGTKVLPNSSLPPITVTGDHNSLHVTFGLPVHLLESLPEPISAGEGISLCPILFNIGLQQLDESSEQYKFEQQLNEESFVILRDYYRSVRQLRLYKASEKEVDMIEQTIKLGEIKRPLDAMDPIINQLEGNIREPTSAGVPVLCLLSELIQRLGGISVIVCDNGTHKSHSVATMHEVMVLARCYGLQFRSIRLALTALRKSDAIPFLTSKNSITEYRSFPDKAPGLFRLSADEFPDFSFDFI